jgi:hypothetical protein
MVTCSFVNVRRGTAVIISRAVPEDAGGSFQYTGVPSGTVSSSGTLVVTDLSPGTYTSTQVDPEPDFELKEVYCDDGGSDTESSGDAQTRSAIFNIDPGETVTCTFANVEPGAVYTPTGVIVGGGTDGDGDGTEDDGDSDGGRNPFDDPEVDLDDFTVPEDVPEDAGTYSAPKPGPWSVTHFAGLMACGEFELDIPASPSESGVLEVLDGGQTVIGTGLETAQGVSITMEAAPEITGRYTGSFDGVEQGVPVTIDYFWQVVTDEHIIGFLTSSLTSEGVTCSIYRSFEMFYTGD